MFKVSEPYQITKDDEIHHHFFGYYAISPWCADQSKFLCLRTDFQDHYPKPDDQAQILLLDLENPKENPRVLAKTKGFNLQQGAMLHWLPGCPNRKVVYNEVRHGKVVSLIKDIGADEEAVEMPMGINAMAHGENVALCVSFERLRECRKVCSYASVETNSIQKRPKDDGIYIMDLNTGEVDMILSLQDVWGACRFTKSRKLFTGPFWFNHVVFSPDNSRFSFLSRFRPWFKGYYTSMWTCGLDGKALFQLVDYENRVSHFEWLSPDRLMATAKFGT